MSMSDESSDKSFAEDEAEEQKKFERFIRVHGIPTLLTWMAEFFDYEAALEAAPDPELSREDAARADIFREWSLEFVLLPDARLRRLRKAEADRIRAERSRRDPDD